MRRSHMLALMSLTLFGCEDGRSSDAGTSTASDAGPAGSDAGSGGGTDAGLPDAGLPDAGPPLVCSEPDPGGDCVLRVPVGSFGPLTTSCMPRCSADTAATYRACADNACRTAAIRADTTPGTPYFIGSASITTPMDCEACVTYQEFHCFSLVCTSEVDDYVDNCIVGVTPSLCDANIAAIDGCLATLTPAEEDTVAACYASADGPPGCFACAD